MSLICEHGIKEFDCMECEKDELTASPVGRGVMCAKCGGKVCVCPVDLAETNWWAHCRECKQAIQITETKQEAIKAWNELNT